MRSTYDLTAAILKFVRWHFLQRIAVRRGLMTAVTPLWNAVADKTKRARTIQLASLLAPQLDTTDSNLFRLLCFYIRRCSCSYIFLVSIGLPGLSITVQASVAPFMALRVSVVHDRRGLAGSLHESDASPKLPLPKEVGRTLYPEFNPT